VCLRSRLAERPLRASVPTARLPLAFRLLALLLWAGSPPVQAEPPPAPPAAPLHRLDPVITTATRNEVPPDEVASSVTVITAEEIERKQYRLVSEALRDVPGLDVRRNGGPGTNTSIFIRGADSDHTLVLLDGIELNDPSSPSRVPFLNHLTTDAVERIEIVRGPQSSLYGADAIGGVVHIITKRGDGPLSASGEAEGGSYSTARGSATLAGTRAGFAYALTGSHFSTEGFSASSAGTERDGYRNTTGSGRWGFTSGGPFGADASVRFTDARVEFDGFSSEEGHHTDARQILAQLTPHLSLFEGRWKQELALRTAHHTRDTASSSPTEVDGTFYAIDWKHELHVLEGHLVTLGLEREWEEAEFDTFDDSRHTLALYFQDRITWGERLFGTLGLRFDDPSDFDSHITYRATGGVRIRELHTVVRSSFGTGFKAPSLSQLDSRAFAGNPDLHPEESLGLDVGIETAFWRDRALATATFFYNDVDELIVGVFDPTTGSFLNFNVDRAKTLGVEVCIRIDLLPALHLAGNYTYTDTEARGTPAGFGLEEGGPLLRRPKHKASVDLFWSFLDERGELGASILYVGRRRDLDPVTFDAVIADDYVTLDLNGRFRITRWLEAFGRIENVLDEGYEDVLGFNAPGLSAWGGIRLRY
jgi:vitamin B12 transporter